MKELTNRQLQAKATKNKIARAAMKLLKTEPYDNIKVSDICKLAEISVGGFYHYYDSKEKLVVDAYDIIDKKIVDKYKKNKELAPIEGILKLAEAIALVTTELGNKLVSNCYRQLLVDDTGYTASPDRLVHKELSILIDRAVDEGLIKPDTDKLRLSMYINKLSRGNIFDWCIKKGSFDLNAELQAELKDLLHLFEN